MVVAVTADAGTKEELEVSESKQFGSSEWLERRGTGAKAACSG